MTESAHSRVLDVDSDEYVRIPGLLRRWEIERVLEPESDLHVESAGEAADGTPLFAVYRREPRRKRA